MQLAEQHSIGACPGKWWRLPPELRMIRAFSRVSGLVHLKTHYGDGLWFYSVIVSDKKLLPWLARQSGLDLLSEPPA